MIPQPLRIDPRWLPPGCELPRRCAVRFSPPERRVLRKKRPMPCSEWVERHRVLPGDAAIPGRWKNATTPYLAGIMDASFFESVQHISICAPPQTGKSDCINNCIAYAIDRRPGNVLMVYPDEVTGRENMRDRILPMIQDSERLRAYMTQYSDDAASMRIQLQHMRIYLAWSNSPARLGNKPLPYVVLDEIDKYPPTAGKKESGPRELAQKRTRTFSHMRKIWEASTPTVEDGPIWQALEAEADVVFVYWVRCPDCGHAQRMVFREPDGGPYRVCWEGGGGADPREIEGKRLAWYECAGCGGRWDDAKRNAAVRAGEWRDRDKGIALTTYLQSHRPRHIAFHLKAYVSPFVSLSESAAAFLRGLKDKVKLKDFANAHEAEPWREYRKEREEHKILALAEQGLPAGRVPGGGRIAALIAGVDTQDYGGFWYAIWAYAWGGPTLSKESWLIRAGYLTGWGNLEQVLWGDEYFDADGKKYPVVLAVQDCLGHRTSEVYSFCVRHRGAVVPAVGRDVFETPVKWGNAEFYPGTNKPIPGGLKLLRVNGKYFKDDLARRLEINPGDPGRIHLYEGFPAEYARHFTAEYVNDKGLWECPPHRHNHLWDCSVYAAAGHEVLGVVHWAEPRKPKAAPRQDKPKRGTWRDRGEWEGPKWLEQR